MNEINTKKPNIKNAAILIRSVEIEKPVDTVFNFIIYKLKDNYTATANGHIKYEIIGGDCLKEGVLIDCRETAANQEVHHIYKVKKIIPNQHIYYLSTPSKVFIKFPWKTVESHSNCYCYFDFEKVSENITKLQLTIAIQFDNWFQKSLSTLFCGIVPWKKHQKEELEKLKELTENN